LGIRSLLVRHNPLSSSIEQISILIDFISCCLFHTVLLETLHVMLVELVIFWQLHVVWCLPVYHVQVKHYHFSKSFKFILYWLQVFLSSLLLHSCLSFLKDFITRFLQGLHGVLSCVNTGLYFFDFH
jgi:hypothetical protein